MDWLSTEVYKELFLHILRGKGDCRQEGLVYKGICLKRPSKGLISKVGRDGSIIMVEQRKLETKSIYWGETSFGTYNRGKRHLNLLKNQNLT